MICLVDLQILFYAGNARWAGPSTIGFPFFCRFVQFSGFYRVSRFSTGFFLILFLSDFEFFCCEKIFKFKDFKILKFYFEF
jgi:hypothetical protein